jgi:hypothetical protein
MLYAKAKVLERLNAAKLTQFMALAGTATLLPFYIHLQWVSGPIVNAILIITLFLVGIRSALVLCMVPSLMALSGGLLPAVMAPVVPFIMLSNMIMVLTIDWVYNNFKDDVKGFFTGIGVASFVKFAFLYLSVGAISKLLIKQEFVAKVAQMMSWPQFATALAGGLLAFVVLRWLKRI